jgi:endonuclease/exonuclease/phosphatase family metal-dependent hydrolase
MPVYPAAKKLLIPAGSNDPRIKPRVAILHVDAGNAESLYTFFRDRSGGIESHFHIRKDGVVEQYRDTDYQADANNLANDFAVSIETQGFGAGEWNTAQLDAIKKLLLWLNDVHDIPLEKCRAWNGSGVGYHTLFGAPSQWTPVAKSCPGPDRKVQFENVIVPWMKAALKPKPAPKPAPKPEPKPRTEASVVQVVTANIRHALPATDVRATLDRLTKSPADIICLQEMSGRRALVEAAEALGFDSYIPDLEDTIGEAACPILWRADMFELKRDDVYPATERTKVPARAAGPSNFGVKYVTRASLVHKATGRTVHVINAHFPPSHQVPQMLDLAETMARAIGVIVAPLKGQVLIAGDFNTTDPLALADGVLADAGFTSNHAELDRIPTHGKRAIDAVLFRGPALEITAHRTLTGLPSDHLPLLCRFNLTAKESA